MDRLEPYLERYLDPLISAGRTRRAPFLLAAGMLASLVYVLYVSRGATFSGDELTWIIQTKTLTLESLFAPQGGHLHVVARPLYKLMIEVFGTDYLAYRVVGLATVYFAVAVLFAYARRRVGDYVALAPCLLLLFYGSDSLHLLQGNATIIMLSVAAGLLALLMLERRTGTADVIACIALIVGVAAYSVALAFLAGAIVAVLVTPGARRRIWVVAIPTGLYLIWQVWFRVKGLEVGEGSTQFTNLVLLPAWTFQSLSGILNSLTGFNYDFSGSGALPPGAMAGPALALVFLGWAGWRISRGGLRPWLVVAIAVTLAMFASQLLIWEPGGRQPAEARYLFPGAFAVLIVLVETVPGLRFSRLAFVALWLVALSGLSVNAVIARDHGAELRVRTELVRADASAAALIQTAGAAAPVPKNGIATEESLNFIGPIALEYPGLDYEPGSLAEAPPAARAQIDAHLAGALDLSLAPLGRGEPKGCFPSAAEVSPVTGAPRSIAEVPAGGATLFSRRGGPVTVRRFGDEFTLPVGDLKPGEAASLTIPEDRDPTPWRVSLEGRGLELCPPAAPAPG